MKRHRQQRVYFLEIIPAIMFIFVLVSSSSAITVQPQLIAEPRGTYGLKSDGTILAVGDVFNLQSWQNITQIDTTPSNIVGVKSDGTVVAIGGMWAYYVSSWTDIIQVSTATVTHTVGLKSDGTVVLRNTPLFDTILPWTDIVQVAACQGGSQTGTTVGVKSDGTVVIVGARPSQNVDSWTDIIKVECSNGYGQYGEPPNYQIVGVRSDGTVVITGDPNPNYDSNEVSSWTDIVQVSVGFGRILGVKSDGTVVGVGYDSYDVLNVSSWTDIVDVDGTGQFHTVGLKSDGSVVVVGLEWKYQFPVDWDLGVDSNRPPTLESIGSKIVNEGETLTFTVTATDPDSDNLSFSASNLPIGASFDPTTQTFTWTPTWDQAGNFENLEFTVTDDGDPIEVDTELITITVGNVNRAPVFEPTGSQTVEQYSLLEFNVTASDPDGDAINYYTGNLPAGSSFDTSTQRFSWRPGQGQEGIHVITFYAQDNGNTFLTGQLEIAITVGNVPTPIELADKIITVTDEMNLPQEVENSYMANLKKTHIFISEGKITPTITQLDAVDNKVTTDMVKGSISVSDGGLIIEMTGDLKGKLQP